MATSWSNYNNGDTGLVVRNAINTFNTGISSDMTSAESRLTATEGTTSTNTGNISTNTGNISTNATNISTNTSNIADLQGAQSETFYTDVTGSEPSYIKGQRYFANGVMNTQGDYSDVIIQDGREIHLEVVNNSGALITNGKVCRHNGVSGGVPQIELCLADTFINATVLGVATHDIPNGSLGILTIFGKVGMNTVGLPAGVPLYVSPTVPGDMTDVVPDITSQVGGVLLVDASTGQFEVVIRNNVAIPTILGLLQGQAGTGIYSVTAAAQPINDYFFEGSVVMAVDKVLGTIDTPATGFYNGAFTAAMSFASSTSTRTIYIEIFETTVAGIIFTLPFNIPRDATETGISFSSKFLASAGHSYQMRIRSSVAITVTFADLDMDIESVRI